MWSPMLAFIVTGIPRSANSRLTASPSSRVLNITAIDATPSPRSSMNSFHRLGPSTRLEQLEVERPDHHLGALQRVVDALAAQLGVVMHRRLVVEHVPSRPAERAPVALHRLFEVAHGQRDLRDRVLKPGEALWQVARRCRHVPSWSGLGSDRPRDRRGGTGTPSVLQSLYRASGYSAVTTTPRAYSTTRPSAL